MILLSLLGRSQQIISGSSKKLLFSVPYRTYDLALYANGNTVLREMAKDVIKEPWQVRILVSLKVSWVIYQQGDKNQLSIFFIKPVISGDNIYRRFPISDVLLPSKVNLKLKWANRLDTTSFSEAAVNSNFLSTQDSLLCSFPVPSFDPTVDTLMISDVELFYDSLGVVTFKKRLDLINDYYAAGLILDSLKQTCTSIDLNEPASLPANFIRIEEFNKLVQRIHERDFQGTLILDGFDPCSLSEKYSSIYKCSRSLTFTFMDELKKAGAIPWQGDIDILAGYFTDRVLLYIRRSMLMDKLQSNMYQDFLDHSFDNSSFPAEENITGMLFSKMYPDASRDTIAEYVSGRIYNSYREKAGQLMQQNQYSEAFSIMEHSRRLVERIPFIRGVLSDDSLQSKAAYGIYNSYTGIARECIINRKYSMADSYLAKANQYAIEHATLIGSDSLYLAVFSELFFLRNSECDLLLEQMKFAEALDCYQSFEIKYNDRDLKFVRNQLDEKKTRARAGLFHECVKRLEDALMVNQKDTVIFYYEQALLYRNGIGGIGLTFNKLDSLAPAVARIRIERFFNSGALALGQRQYTHAQNLFAEVKVISDKYGIARDPKFDSLFRQTMKYCLIIQLSTAQKKIWANQFDSAMVSLDAIKTTGFNYGLSDDQVFSAAINNFMTKISEQHCRNLRDSVNLQIIRADRSIASKNYLKASGYLKMALTFIASTNECMFSYDQIRDTLAKYSQAADYQQKLLDAYSKVASGNYDAAVFELNENEQTYQLNCLDRFGLLFEGVYDFISQRANPYLTERAISFYFDRGNRKEALRYLRLLRIQEYPCRNTVQIQNQLGKTLAIDDYQVNPKETALRLVELYTANDVWYNVFRSSFLNEWKSLSKKASVEK